MSQENGPRFRDPLERSASPGESSSGILADKRAANTDSEYPPENDSLDRIREKIATAPKAADWHGDPQPLCVISGPYRTRELRRRRKIVFGDLSDPRIRPLDPSIKSMMRQTLMTWHRELERHGPAPPPAITRSRVCRRPRSRSHRLVRSSRRTRAPADADAVEPEPFARRARRTVDLYPKAAR